MFGRATIRLGIGSHSSLSIYCAKVLTVLYLSASNGLCAGHQNFMSPITPAELLIALHGIDPTKVDVKTIIKGMTLLCCRL